MPVVLTAGLGTRLYSIPLRAVENPSCGKEGGVASNARRPSLPDGAANVNTKRLSAQDHGSREPAGGKAGKRDNAVDVLLLLVTVLALLGIAAGIAIRFPWALENATTYADASPAISSGSPAPDQRHQPEDAIEETSEPFIADDIRTEGLMYASAGITTSIPRSTSNPSRLIC
jgi:hypothetical protein